MKPNFDLLDEVVLVKGTNKKIELLQEAIKDDDTRNFIDIIFNPDVYGIAEISINKAMKTSTKLFLEKKTFPEQLEFMKNLSGNNQIDSLSDFFSYQPQQHKEWYKRALLKDFPSVGIKSYNKARVNEGFEPLEVFELQLCASILIDINGEVIDWAGLNTEEENFLDYKYDGNRTYTIKNGRNVSFISRNGKEILSLGLLKEHILNKYPNDDFIIDGEVIDRNDDFNTLSTKIRRLKDMAITDFKYQVFDIIKFNGEDYKKKSQYKRRLFIEKYFKNDNLIQVSESYVTTSASSIMDYYNEIISKGGEGIIIKSKDKPYEYGSRKNWWKLKPVYEGTFEIYDVELGSGKYQGKISAIWIKDKYESIKCKVGSGLTELDVEDLTNMGRNELIGKFVDIFYSEIGPKGLRFPRFKEPSKEDKERNIRWRDDKEEADDLIPLKAKFEMIKEEQKDKQFRIKEPEEIEW